MVYVICVLIVSGAVYLERLAILHGINGVALSSCMTLLGAVAGYLIGSRKE